MSALGEHGDVIAGALRTPPRYRLPAEVAGPVDKALEIHRVDIPAPEITPAEVKQHLIEKLLAEPGTAARTDVTKIAKAAQAHTDWEARADLLRLALPLATQRVTDAVRDHVDLMAAAIREAGEENWTQAEAVAAALAEVDASSSDNVMRAGPDATASWLRLADLAQADADLRTAFGSLHWPDEKPEWDTERSKALESTDHQWFPSGWCKVLGKTWQRSANELPWPEPEHAEHLRQRMLWLIKNAGERPHWASPSQRDACWQRAHPEQYRAKREQDQRHWQAHAS